MSAADVELIEAARAFLEALDAVAIERVTNPAATDWPSMARLHLADRDFRAALMLAEANNS